MKKITLILGVLTVLLSFSCKKNNNMETEVQGLIKLYDQKGYMITSNDVKISLSGIEDSVLTDETGKFFLKKVTAGTYDITINKTGFPEFKIYGFQVLANGQPTRYLNTLKIAELPKIKVQNIRDTVIYIGYISTIGFNVDVIKNNLNDEDNYVLIMYISHSPNVSINNYEEKELLISNTNHVSFVNFNYEIEEGMYAVVYSHPYSSSSDFYIDPYFNSDTITEHPYSNMIDLQGHEYNPYYIKVSETYFYE
ncbi:MAG: carboxypeptidase regulatory-like domain-containing protein [Bacteroidales bacterium]|nr:carboxypeptidase regulatory-like domain-containing protein [Bacteroidales bacterium]